MKIRVLAGMTAAGSVIVLTGCGTGTSVPSSEPSQSGSPQAASPIPPVKNPRDVAAMARRPCELLTAKQAAGFELDLPPEQLDGLLGTLRCKWTNTTRDGRIVRTVDVSMFTDNPTLEVAYSQNQSLPFFKLTEIAGYPALVTRTNADIPDCDIDVKVAERQSVTVIFESKEFDNNPQQACAVGKEVAAAVVMNLPPAT